MGKSLASFVAITLFSLIILGREAFAQDTTDDETVLKLFVVVKMERQYENALHKAYEASERLHLALNLRGLKYNREIGLSLSREECDSNGWEYPMDYPRGRFDDGNYVSIEWSNTFDSLKGGSYVVVVASGENNKEWLLNTLKGARKVYPDAFITRSKVFLGCMH
jgi:hypothetical protein